MHVAKRLVTSDNLHLRATSKGETVLHFAARIKSEKMVEMLLRKQADQRLVNYSGKSSLDMVLASPLMSVPELRATKLDQVIEDQPARDSEAVPSGSTEKSAYYEWEQRQISRGKSRVDFIIENKLKLGISEEDEKVAVLLIVYGVDPNSKEAGRETPLQLATLYDLPRLVKTLLEMGADPLLKWHCPYTPVEIAEKLGNKELALMLRTCEQQSSRAIILPTPEASVPHMTPLAGMLPQFADFLRLVEGPQGEGSRGLKRKVYSSQLHEYRSPPSTREQLLQLSNSPSSVAFSGTTASYYGL